MVLQQVSSVYAMSVLTKGIHFFLSPDVRGLFNPHIMHRSLESFRPNFTQVYFKIAKPF